MNIEERIDKYLNEAKAKPKGNPILPMGKVNLKTGKNKIFNIYDEWENTNMIAEIYKTTDRKNPYVVIFGHGKKAMRSINDSANFVHDQNWRQLFYGTLVDYFSLEELKNAISKYGNSLKGYVYK